MSYRKEYKRCAVRNQTQKPITSVKPVEQKQVMETTRWNVSISECRDELPFFLKKKKKDNKSNVVATLLLQPNQMFQC